jgi:hypothetical protein
MEYATPTTAEGAIIRNRVWGRLVEWGMTNKWYYRGKDASRL